MQTKNKTILIIFIFFNLFFFNLNVSADEFNISAKEIIIDQSKDIITGVGDVEITDSEGRIIKGNKTVYEKKKELITVEGSAIIYDINNNILKSNRITYNKKEELIITYENSELIINEGYELTSNKILYDTSKKIISSDQDSIFSDMDGNIVEVNMFQYQSEKNLFSSIGKIKIIDINKNKYFFKELHVDTKKKEMIGSEASVILDNENFGVEKENDPRFVSNVVSVSKNKSIFSKGAFTICKKRKDKCPPWLLQAKKITHDKTKKTIYYEHAVLKVYDVPVFYFPKFFHPDPTVKRQSGFLNPFFTDSTTVGTGFGLPYYWAISADKDFTFTPKFYSEENILLLNEYRQAFKNGFLILDYSYNQGYKKTSSTKTDGSRNHIFAELDLDLSENESYESNLSLKVQRTSNDTFFRIHDINTELVNAENTDLENEITYSYSKEDMYLSVQGSVYENLREKTNSRYEYILPNVLFGKSFFTEKLGILDFESNAFYKNYSVNKHTTFLTNDIIWKPYSFISSKGFVNTLEGMVKNINYDAKNTTDYKTAGTINEINGVLNFKSSFPMKKESTSHFNTFSPNFMVRYAPGHMRDLSKSNLTFKYADLFSTNKTSVIEDGLSAILGFEFKMNEKNSEQNKEKLSISMGQVFNPEENKDMPSRSSLDQKMSDVVGEIKYNFSEIGNIDYKFSVDHNLNELNYNEISTILNFSKVDFNLGYLEEQNHIGKEHYINSGITLKFNDKNKLSFNTKKNFKTESIEFYDINYQYINDCLTAGLVFRREFYEDNDLEEKDSLMFVIKFRPFTGVKAPLLTP